MLQCTHVPTVIALLFPCCRQLQCCPDQAVGSRRSLGTKAIHPRKLPGISVSVSIEETSSTHSSYERLMVCFKQHGTKCVSMSVSMAAPTSSPTSNAALGRRSLQHNKIVCAHNGTVTKYGTKYFAALALFKSKTDKGNTTVR